MEDRFYVYLWTNKLNGKRYVGKGKGKRAWSHVEKANKNGPTNSLLIRAMRKHGVENFELYFLHDNLCEVEAFELESFYIHGLRLNICREYEEGVFGVGYNQTDGGDGVSGHRLSDEHKRKLSALMRGKKKHSEEFKRRLSEINRGKSLSKETRRKLSEAHRGKRMSEETKKKLSEVNTGKKYPNQKPLSVEHRRKVSEALKGRRSGEKHPFFGRKHSDETKRKMSESRRRENLSEETRMKLSQATRRRHSKNRLNMQFKALFADPKLPVTLNDVIERTTRSSEGR